MLKQSLVTEKVTPLDEYMFILNKMVVEPSFENGEENAAIEALIQTASQMELSRIAIQNTRENKRFDTNKATHEAINNMYKYTQNALLKLRDRALFVEQTVKQLIETKRR